MIINSMIILTYNYMNSVSIFLVLISIVIIGLACYFEYRFTKLYRNLYYREELFNSLSNTIDDVFVVRNIESQELEYVSPNSERILGISHKVLNKTPHILLEYTDSDSKSIIEDLFTTNIVPSHNETECKIFHPKTNEITWLMLRIYPIIEKHRTNRFICCISDLTKEKQSQQILKDALLNAQKAYETRRDFLSHMSHEIRTPIYTIIGMNEIATKSLDDKAKVRNCMDKISLSSKHLLALINDILDMSKLDNNKMQLTKEPFHLIQLLNNFSSIIVSQAELKQQEFRLILNDIQDKHLVGDTLRLNQILMNCLSNSLKFTPVGGIISLEVTELEKRDNKALFRFIVTDNGKGMSEDYIERIFIPFDQEDSSIERKYGGSGLGMSITKNLVTLMDGTIHVKSKLGLGTTITVDLVFEIKKGYLATKAPTIKNKAQNNYNFSGQRILVVEDNEINLEITFELLKLTNAIIETAKNGKEAFELFINSTPGYYDLILMDVHMPELNGYETAKAIRNSSHPDSSICIIAMTANSYVEDIAASRKSGMNYHISKPIETDKFYSLLHNIIKTKQNVSENNSLT